MKKTLKIATTTLLLTTVGASVTVPTAALAQAPQTWTQRSVEEIIATLEQQSATSLRYYTVQWGDTLSTIARALKMDLGELIRINHISNPDFILAGTILIFDEENGTLTEITEAGEETVYSTQTGETIEDVNNEPSGIKEVTQEAVFTPEVALSLPTVNQEPTATPAVEEVSQEAPTVEETQEVEATPAASQEETDVQTPQAELTQEETAQTVVEESSQEEAEATTTTEVENVEESSDLDEMLEENEIVESSKEPEMVIEPESTYEGFGSIEEEPVDENELEDNYVPIESLEEDRASFDEVAEPQEPATVVDTSNMSAREAFDSLAAEKGLTASEIDGWAYIIQRESNWDPQAVNPTSGAYGLAQNIDPSRYASHGDDWETNPHTQLEWMYDYMTQRYGSIQGALDFWNSNHWY